jgi:3-methyl-2-oxobutanoate hydroxymethyltransferase
MSELLSPIRIPDLQAKKTRGEKITMLTAYDAWMARILDGTGAIDMLLVGDSLGMVELGYDTTLPVTMHDIIRHTRAARQGAPSALIVADLPFLSHQVSVAQALRNAGALLQKGGATAVKLEGGRETISTVERMVSSGIPVMGHLGLQPQSVHLLGGFRQQAKRPEEQKQLLENAARLEEAGAFAIVLECVPDSVARDVTAHLRIPVIGIGSGPHCDGQVLVVHDILGLTGPKTPPFAKQYAALEPVIAEAAKSFSEDVRCGRFPARPATKAVQCQK